MLKRFTLWGARILLGTGMITAMVGCDSVTVTSMDSPFTQRLGWLPGPTIPSSTPEPTSKPIVTPPPPTSPPVSNGPFVIRSGTRLLLNQKTFRIVGPNIYWLGLDENVWPSPSYPSQQRIAEAFAIAQAMGATTVRSHTLGVSTGNSLSLLTGLGQYNEAAFNSIDFAIYQARLHNIKLIIPFTDDYHYYHGGKLDFVYNRQLDGNDTFYSNPTVVSDFKDYIRHLITHVNPYTKLAYKDDPTILAWETGNELGTHAPTFGNPPPASWTQTIAQFVKSIDPNHLIANGHEGVSGDELSIRELDLFTRHTYNIDDWQTIQNDFNTANQYNKVYYVGEYGANSGNLNGFLANIESSGVAGDLWWSLFGHGDNCSSWVTHNDGPSMTYGMNSSDNWIFLALTDHALKLEALPIVSSIPVVACFQNVSRSLSSVNPSKPSQTSQKPRTRQKSKKLNSH